jgi:hypothetical protein
MHAVPLQHHVSMMLACPMSILLYLDFEFCYEMKSTNPILTDPNRYAHKHEIQIPVC